MNGIRKRLCMICALVLSLTLIAVSGINICAVEVSEYYDGCYGGSEINTWGARLDGKLDRSYWLLYPLTAINCSLHDSVDNAGTVYVVHDRENLYVLVSLDCKLADFSSEQCEESITVAIDWDNKGESTSYYTVNYPNSDINGNGFEYAIRVSGEKFNVEYKIPLQCDYERAEIGFDVEVKYKNADGVNFTAIYDGFNKINGLEVSHPEYYNYIRLAISFQAVQWAYFLDVSGHFTSEPEYPWYYNSVKYCFRNSLMSGVSDDYFAPNMEMSRAMFAQVLYNMEGKPDISAYENKFTDVNEDDWFYNAVLWASNNGVVAGTSDTAFSPNENITREQLLEMLYRYAKSKEYDVTASADMGIYKDAGELSAYAEDALKWSVGVGLISGNKINGETLLDPRGNATRAQVAMILEHFCEKAAK